MQGDVSASLPPASTPPTSSQRLGGESAGGAGRRRPPRLPRRPARPAAAATSPTPGVHQLSAYGVEVKAVLAELRLDAKTNEHKATLQLLGVGRSRSRSPAAMPCSLVGEVGATVIDGAQDDVLPMKDDQGRRSPATSRAPSAVREAGLSPPPGGARARPRSSGVRSRQGARPTREAVDRDRLVARRLLSSDWPSCAQVYRLTRPRRIGEDVEIEVVLRDHELCRASRSGPEIRCRAGPAATG